MIVIAGVLFGIFWGATLAKRRKGTVADMALYAFGFAVAFGIGALFLTILLERML